MNTIKIPLSSATPEQVRAFAGLLGVDMQPSDSPETVLAKLKMVYSGSDISVPDAAASDPISFRLDDGPRFASEDREVGESSEFSKAVGAARLVGSVGKDDPRVVISVQTPRYGNDVSKMQNYVTVGVNGVGFQIACGKPVDVPYRVYEALNNAVRDEVTHNEDGEVVNTPVQAYPFNVLEMPSRAEIARWHEATDDVVMA